MDGNEIEHALTCFQATEVRRALAGAAGLSDDPPSGLFRLFPPDRLTRVMPDGSERSVDSKQFLSSGPSALLLEGFTSKDEVIPVEPTPGNVWGYWILPEETSTAAAEHLSAVFSLVRTLVHLEEDERIRAVSEDILAVFGLGHALVQSDGPADMARIVHTVAGQVLHASSTILALLGPDAVRLYRFFQEGRAESCPIPSEAWQKVFPPGRASWGPGDPTSSSVGALLGCAPLSGMIEPLGDQEKPVAYLLLLGGETRFTEREQGLFARVADFVFANVMRWEQLEGVRKKSRQVTDLLVLLAQGKELLDFIMRSVSVGMLLVEGSGNIAVANDPAAKALGLTEVELKEKKIFSSRPEGRALLGFIEKARAEKRVVSTPYQMEERWFQVQVVPWPGGAQFLVVTQDIQDWYQLNRLKEDLISIISHEVKNPLTAIVNAADLLSTGRTGPLTEAQARIASLILENGTRIRILLDDVVRLSRVHHLGGQREPVPLKPLIEKLRAASQDTIQGKLLVWREELQEVSVLGEPRMLENLFMNLIGNAIKYTSIGGHVGVRLWTEEGWAKFRVADDGPGIPAKEREKLFSPFFRASNVREQVAGTGLGLVIAHNVAERMGGRLDVVSPLPNEDVRFLACPNASRPGTAFQVELPLGT